MGRYKLKLYLYTSFQKYHDRRERGKGSEVAFPLRPNGPFQCCSVLLFKCKEMPCFSVPRFQAVKTTTAQSYLSHSLSLWEAGGGAGRPEASFQLCKDRSRGVRLGCDPLWTFTTPTKPKAKNQTVRGWKVCHIFTAAPFILWGVSGPFSLSSALELQLVLIGPQVLSLSLGCYSIRPGIHISFNPKSIIKPIY